MITIQSKSGLITVSGHSGYAPPGQDIVCAAISALTQTLVASVEKLTNGEIKRDIRQGHAVIKYKDLSGSEMLLIRSFLIGVEGVAAAYPEYVKII